MQRRRKSRWLNLVEYNLSLVERIDHDAKVQLLKTTTIPKTAYLKPIRSNGNYSLYYYIIFFHFHVHIDIELGSFYEKIEKKRRYFAKLKLETIKNFQKIENNKLEVQKSTDNLKDKIAEINHQKLEIKKNLEIVISSRKILDAVSLKYKRKKIYPGETPETTFITKTEEIIALPV